ncbi:FAD-dependent oxidoreductase [Zhongshania aquimaris]|uniref:FAD-dependent oxidoreductase n=1 Tax=Zhongshania aquimaris TaxID=2857107 RepID=A0ABS6VUG1_9GAMM|nr:FAD-dependent oxidoreductase [Zhongshania aquimaris]MBW2941365.1 FAD-dependent oxidoreductase [Zhongshania aquimaris]
MKKTTGIERRKFIKGVAGGALLATAQVASSARADDKPVASDWDREVDVVVIGSGTGLCAALVCAKAGNDVIVLEKNSGPGGNTLVSGGVLWIPNNHVMAKNGLADSRNQAMAYLRKLAQGQSDETLMEAFLDNGPEAVQFIEFNTDITWRATQIPGIDRVSDYHPEWHGSVPYGRSIEPETDIIGHMAGGYLVSSLLVSAQKAGVELLTEAPATELVTRTFADGSKKVIGVIAEYQGQLLRIRVRNGVLIASGGFERNSTMKTHFLRGPSPYTLGTETNTGDGIRMGMAIGADLRNMNELWGITVYKGDAEINGAKRGGISLMAQFDRSTPGMICVNRYGERFCNESADYDSTWRSYHTWENWGDLRYRNLPAFHIFDHTSRERFGIFGRSKDQSLPDWIAKADTLSGLAKKLGIDEAGLNATVARFNMGAREGRDPDFHRGESAWDVHGTGDSSLVLAPLEQGPFYGAEVSPADLGTCGGLRVNSQAQVIDVFERPIEGLYCAGNASGVGSPGASYGGGGGTIGPAMTFSYIAGKALSALS